MADNSQRPPSDLEADDAFGVAGYLLDEALPDVAASRIAAELGAAMASRPSRRRRVLVAAALLATAAAAAVLVTTYLPKPRPDVTTAPAPTEQPKVVAPPTLPPPAPRPIPDWKLPKEQPVEAMPPARESAALPAPETPVRKPQPKETPPLVTQGPMVESAVPAPSVPTIVNNAVAPVDSAETMERTMTLMATRTDRSRGRSMFLRITYRPSPPDPPKETP